MIENNIDTYKDALRRALMLGETLSASFSGMDNTDGIIHDLRLLTLILGYVDDDGKTVTLCDLTVRKNGDAWTTIYHTDGSDKCTTGTIDMTGKDGVEETARFFYDFVDGMEKNAGVGILEIKRLGD